MSFWKKIKELFNPSEEGVLADDSQDDLVSFKEEDPIDVQFTKNFTAGGGYFFYCEDEQEVLINLKAIIENEGVDKFQCFDKEICSLLKRLNAKFDDDITNNSEFAFIKCEYLVAFNGVVMISSDQTGGKKNKDLPNNIIVYAHPDQLVSNLSEALQKLRRAKEGSLPSNITSLNSKGHHGVDTSQNKKTIYLLLVESVQ